MIGWQIGFRFAFKKCEDMKKSPKSPASSFNKKLSILKTKELFTQFQLYESSPDVKKKQKVLVFSVF